MPLTSPMHTGAETTASRYELPAWYTQYGQSMTGAGLGQLNQNVGNYRGYSTNGVWNPTVAPMAGNETSAYNIASGGNIGGWQGGFNTALGTMGSGLGQIAGATNNFNQAQGTIGGATNNFNSATGAVNQATGDFNAARGNIGAATGNYNQATGQINSATGNFNSADNSYNQADSSYGQAGTGLGQAGSVLNSGRGILNSANPSMGNAGNAFGWGMNNLNPAANNTMQGGTTLNGNPGNQAALDAYMNPYRYGVADEIARMANQNLVEKMMPEVNSTFAGAGQFGSTRNGDFLARALRDNQSTITGAQSQVLLAGMNEAMKNYGLEKERQLSSGRDLGALSQVSGQLGQGYLDQAGRYVDMTNANTNIGQALNQNASLYTDLGRARTDTGTARTNTGNARVNQGLASRAVGDSRVNQGLANRAVGDSVVNQGLAHRAIGDSVVGQGDAMTRVGLGRVSQGAATGNIGAAQSNLAQMRNAAALNDVNALLGTGAVNRDVRQKQLDSNLALWKDWRDHPINSLGALSQVLPNVSGRIQPDNISSIGYIGQQPDVYKNLQEILNTINGRS